MLVARADELGKLAATRPDATPQLVAGGLPGRVRTLGHKTGAGCSSLFHFVPNRARRFAESGRLGVEGIMHPEHGVPAPRELNHEWMHNASDLPERGCPQPRSNRCPARCCC